MEHNLRPIAAENLIEAMFVLRITDYRNHGLPGKSVVKLLLDGIERELGDLEQHNAGGRKARDLAAELGADGPPGASDQNRLTIEKGVQASVVQLDRIAPEQVVELDGAQRRDAHFA